MLVVEATIILEEAVETDSQYSLISLLHRASDVDVSFSFEATFLFVSCSIPLLRWRVDFLGHGRFGNKAL